ncbi:acyltransferase [Thermoactinomyces sp. DSM 45892]|uniref:acyltransferase n=1 Tax=Thermoactinomyces sp. DSM 45892 TaxID=1882753 RepID=UPI00089C31BA|nr:acyltransferase [Thermoactinomyces sp. DSM 45892]SDX99394.1 Peptidoglycan/LPS O-acetylase OafA/YrhL, contains acyltransferase and SGNH-hydrolase domains [Thermoactinomyces sp. DSM 45892]
MKRNYSIDLLKFFATIAVVVIHTNPFQKVDNLLGMKGKYLDLALDAFSRFAVPFFFLVSGYLFSQKMMNLKYSGQVQYYKKYMYKIGKLLVTWTIFYLLLGIILNISTNLAKGTYWRKEIFTDHTFEDVWDIIYYGINHLWYLNALIVCISIIFIVKRRYITYLLAISLALHLIGFLGQGYSVIYDLSIETRDALFFGLFYTTLGSVIGYNMERIGRWLKYPKIYLGLFFFFSLTSIVECYISTYYLEAVWKEYFLSTMIAVPALFLFSLSKPLLGRGSYLTKIGSKSVGIYVIHMLFVKLTIHLFFLLGTDGLDRSITWQMVYTPVVFVTAYLAYEGLQIVKRFFAKKKLDISN